MENVRTVTALYIGGKWLPPGSPVPLVEGFNYEKAARKGQIEHVDGEPIANPAAGGMTATAAEDGAEADSLLQANADLKADLGALHAALGWTTGSPVSAVEMAQNVKGTAETNRQELERWAGRARELEAQAAELAAERDRLQDRASELEAAQAQPPLPADARERLIAVDGINAKLADKALAALTAPAQAE